MKILIPLLLFSFFQCSHADNVSVREGQKHFFHCIENYEDHWNTEPLAKSELCRIIRNNFPKGTKVRITSGCRGPGCKSRHHPGPDGIAGAIDFYIVGYPGGLCGNIKKYIQDSFVFARGLDNSDVIQWCSYGIYGYSFEDGEPTSDGLVFHWDCRGRPNRWGRVNGQYVTIQETILALEEVYQDRCLQKTPLLITQFSISSKIALFEEIIPKLE